VQNVCCAFPIYLTPSCSLGWMLMMLLHHLKRGAKPGTGKLHVQTTEKRNITCFCPQEISGGKHMANTFSCLRWPPTTRVHAMIDTELSFVTLTQFLSKVQCDSTYASVWSTINISFQLFKLRYFKLMHNK
jgi:hypothetical protein